MSRGTVMEVLRDMRSTVLTTTEGPGRAAMVAAQERIEALERAAGCVADAAPAHTPGRRELLEALAAMSAPL